ncbi:carbohydrate ABC transporter permease [Hahella sp. SMD15-11]|uniref:Carbohydrate ABC transporter permease n=1 Tax=Thermohahella caldifontis TaxID=3142973 RepID=A0AB39USQ4_9GAMM
MKTLFESLTPWLIRATMLGLMALLIISALMTVFPFLWSAILSTHSREMIFSTDIILTPGNALQANYDKLMEIMPFWQAMFNSFYVALLGTAVSLMFCSMGGYAFAVYRFKGKNLLFGVLVGSMMVPPVLGLIPYYLTVKFLGLMDTHLAVWLPFTATPFCIFLVRQYVVASIPKELLESARMDGAGEFLTYWKIALPLMRPVLATVGIVQFVFFWNNFINPLVVLNSTENYVITLALRSVQNLPNTPWGAVMLGTTISMLPILAFYLFSSRQIISGMTSGAVKG